MKKVLLAIISGIFAVGAMAFAACDTSSINEYLVSAAEAKTIALAHTGLSEEQVENPTVVLETNGNTAYYDVEFIIDGVSYCYRIDTTTGEIQKLTINEQPVAAESAPAVPSSTTGTTTYIGFDAAKAIAFADANVTAEEYVTSLDMEFDFDDGQYLYEIDFVYESAKYDYEITATSGEIYKKNVNSVTVSGNYETTANYIGTDAAMAIALADAGLTTDQAQFTKVEFDKDKGVHIYEIEFVYNYTEYEYEINAETGAIIQAKTDHQTTATPTEDGYIGVTAAKEIALAHAGVSADNAVFKECKLDREKGKYVYEIEFVAGGYEYEYEIDAETGSIIEWEKERDD